MSTPSIVFVAVASSDNAPLYTRTFRTRDDGSDGCVASRLLRVAFQVWFCFIFFQQLDLIRSRSTDTRSFVRSFMFGRATTLARAHAALDAADARLRERKISRFLGEAYRAHDAVAYAYATCTRTRMVLGYDGDASEAVVREDFDALAFAYARAMCAPFRERNDRIESGEFEAAVEALSARRGRC